MTVLHTERMVPGTEKWTESYAEHIVRYRRAISEIDAESALDIGCGVGYGAGFLADRVAQVTAIDYSEEALSIANDQFARDNLTFLQDDAQVLKQVSGPFDLITAFEVFEHIEDADGMVRRSAEMLNPDGVFFCSTPNSLLAPKKEDGVTPRNPHHVREYTLEEFRESMQRQYSRVIILGQRYTDRYMQVSRAMRNVAIQSMTRDLSLRSNPFVRVGLWLQKLRGSVPSFPEPKPGMFPPTSVAVMPPIEEDFVLS